MVSSNKHDDNINEINIKFNELEKMLKIAEDRITDNNNTKADKKDLNALRKLLKSFEQALKEMGASIPSEVVGPTIDNSENDERFLNIENNITLLQALSETLFPTSEAEIIKKRLLELEKLLKQKANNEDLNAVQNQIDSLNQDLNDIRSHLTILENESAKKSDVNTINQQLKIIEMAIEQLQKTKPSGKSGIDNERFELEIKELRKLIDLMNKDMLDKFKDHQSQIDLKADLDTLWTVEAKLLEKIDQVAAALLKKFADKAETKKALKHLEKQIRTLFDLLNNREVIDDAMFARKPLGGYSCASCDKDIQDLQGVMAQ